MVHVSSDLSPQKLYAVTSITIFWLQGQVFRHAIDLISLLLVIMNLGISITLG